MGAGNFIPHCHSSCWEMVYVEPPDEHDDLWLEDLEIAIDEILPPSFWKPDRETYKYDMSVMATNRLIDLCIGDNYTTVAVAIVAKENEYYEISSLAGMHVSLLAKRLFNGLNERGFDLRVRTSAWTSAEFQPIGVAA